MNLLKYSNGWGHLIMSLATMGVGVYLFVLGDQAVGMSLITTIVAAWFIPGAAKQVATEVSSHVVQAPQPSSTP